MTGDIIPLEKVDQPGFGGSKVPNPYGGVDEDHHRARRRRPGAVAVASLPPSLTGRRSGGRPCARQRIRVSLELRLPLMGSGVLRTDSAQATAEAMP